MRADAERVLFVHAHPADEAIHCGGTIAKLVTEGVGVSVLTCTRGEQAPGFAGGVAVVPGDIDGSGELREREARVALGALGVTDHRFLGAPAARRYGAPPRRYVDSGPWPDSQGRTALAESMHPEALVQADLEELARDVLAVIQSVEPTAIITDDIEASDATPDQIRVFEAVALAAQSSEAPIFVASKMHTQGRMISVDVLDQLGTKKLAIASHASQFRVAGNLYRSSDGQSVELADTEDFRLVPTSLSAAKPRWPELGGSLLTLMLSAAGAFLTGLIVGSVATITYRTVYTIFGTKIPVGLFLAFAAVIGVVFALRLISPTRLYAGLASAGAGAALVLLAVAGFDRNIVVPNTPLGLFWAVVPMLVCLIIVSWPGSETLGHIRHRATLRLQRRLATMGAKKTTTDGAENPGAESRGRENQRAGSRVQKKGRRRL